MTDDAWAHLRWYRLLPFAWLGMLLPVRLGDLLNKLESTDQLTPGPLTAGVATTLAIFGLTGLVVSRRGNPRPIVAALVVLTFAPNLVLGDGWVEMAGPLCGVMLLVVPSPWSWVSYVAAATTDAAVHGVLNDSVWTGLADLSTNANLGLAVFAVTRLARLAEETGRGRSEIAAARAQKELARARDELRVEVEARLSAIIARTESVTANDRWPELTAIASSARDAVRRAEHAATAPDASPIRRTVEPHRIGVSFHFARAMLLGMLACYGINAVSDVGMIPGGLTTTEVLVHSVVTPVACALQLYHGVARADGSEPRWWRWTFAMQWILVVPITMLFPPLLGMSIALVLALSTTLIRLRAPWSFGALGLAVTVGVPVSQHLLFGAQQSISAEIIRYITLVLGMALGPLTFYAVYRLPLMSRRLYETSDELAHVVATTRRLRFARDVHDLLGFHLSAITMTTELAGRAASAEPDRAHRLVTDIRRHAEAALVQIRTIDSEATLHLADEVAAARSLLEAADVRVVADGIPDRPVAASADHVLGVVVREAVTNIVRHSTARQCTIRLRHQGGRARLHLSNDGTATPRPIDDSGGNGLRNLSERVREAGGVLTASLDGDIFTVVADVPA